MRVNRNDLIARIQEETIYLFRIIDKFKGQLDEFPGHAFKYAERYAESAAEIDAYSTLLYLAVNTTSARDLQKLIDEHSRRAIEDSMSSGSSEYTNAYRRKLGCAWIKLGPGSMFYTRYIEAADFTEIEILTLVKE